MKNDKFLNTKEVASILGVTQWTVRQYIKLGSLNAYKFGNGKGKRGKKPWRISQSDLSEFINRGSNRRVNHDVQSV